MEYITSNYKYIFFIIYSIPFIKGTLTHGSYIANKEWSDKSKPWKVTDLAIVIMFPITSSLLIINYHLGFLSSIVAILAAQVLPLTLFRRKFGFNKESRKVANNILKFWFSLVIISSLVYFS
ncbi:hypothetical protein [Pseudoalteromonas rhizosphaerae]|uniref:Uncharacterized protein n=1 Tax=Pseudoalteromonas rhizosphaerae TaxID=2518973 RepID=A0ABW8L1D1_9GAMM